MRHSDPLGCVVQLAYLVDDVREAALRWIARSGAGPFLVRHHPLIEATDGSGRRAQLDHSSAYGQWGAVQVELVQLHEGTSRGLHAGPGLHHVACFVADLDVEQRRLEELGWPAVLSATTASGLRFAFHDARAELGHLVEIYQPQQRVLDFYEQVADASRGWDGRDPVRDLR